MAWAVLTCLAAVGGLLYLFLGRQRAERLISRLTGKLLGPFDEPK
jgi:hypothetical protein